MDNLQEQLNKLKITAAERTKNLDQSKHFHTYCQVCRDFEEWINEQMQMASSEEYGQDYEDMLLLRNKFDEFKGQVEAGYSMFDHCEGLAKWFTDNKGPYSDYIANRQELLRDVWNQLLEQTEARDQRLFGAGEIHRFNRDVEDALTRIQEKYQSVPDDLGRDINSTQSYLKKHEGFENDLIALEAQIQVLLEDCARLQQTYPGENADQTKTMQALVDESWGILQERAAMRKEELLAAADLHRFSADVLDLLSWDSETEKEMQMEVPVRDVHSVNLLNNQHEQLRAEIEAHEDTFEAVIRMGETMVQNGHYAQDEILDKVRQVSQVRDRLKNIWTKKKEYHDQLYDRHVFLRDGQQLNTTCALQEGVNRSSKNADVDTSQVSKGSDSEPENSNDCSRDIATKKDVNISSQNTDEDTSHVLQSGDSDPYTYSDCPEQGVNRSSKNADVDTSQVSKGSDSEPENFNDCPGDIATKKQKKRRSWFGFLKKKK